MPDPDGYPAESELEVIRWWSATSQSDYLGLMDYIRSIWWPDRLQGWTEYDAVDEFGGHFRAYHVSTLGWSGNEEIIGALGENFVAWGICWWSSRRGGHYEFRVPKGEATYGA